MTTHYGRRRGYGLTVTCRNCGATFELLKQKYDTSLCPACNEKHHRRPE